MPARLLGEPAAPSSIHSVVQQWERRTGSPSTQQQRVSSADVGVGRQRPLRPSLPPPAPSSGNAGMRVASATAWVSSGATPLYTHASAGQQGYVAGPHTYASVEDDCSDNDYDEKQALDAYPSPPPSSPPPPQRHYADLATTNVYVGGATELNDQPLLPDPPIFSSVWWPNWSLWPIARVACMRLTKFALHAACINVVVWIPGLTAIICYDALHVRYYARPTFVGVGYFWWSAWLSAVYAAAWACWLLALVMPSAMRLVSRVLTASPSIVRLIAYVDLTQRYLATLLWTICVWLLFLSLVWQNFPGHEGTSPMELNPLASSANNGTSGVPSTGNSVFGSIFAANDTQIAAAAQATSYRNFETNASNLIHISRFFFAVVLSSALLWAQKIFIQSVANSFHLVTLDDRIKQLQSETDALIALHVNAKSAVSPAGFVGKTDDTTLDDDVPLVRLISGSSWAKFRNILSVQATNAAMLRGNTDHLRATAAALSAEPPFLRGNLDTPALFIESSLDSLEATRALARRIFEAYSVSKSASPSALRVITRESVRRVFGGDDKGASKRAFAVLDRDRNGDCTWEECMQACVAIHRERVCLLASMHDVDSAVAKLDVILRGLVATVSLVIIAALLSARFSTLVSSLGTTLLGLSWLVSSTAQEGLASAVWVFCKHPIDVGDVIVVPGLLSSNSSTVTLDPLARLQGYTDGDTFVVEEVQLMSTVLRTISSSKHVQVANVLLAQKPLVNLRRSGPVDEPFMLSVAYDTAFGKIERVRTEMAAWVATQRRDFRIGIEVGIEALDDSARMRLLFTIRYKSDWQNTALRLRRRNRWISALKQVLAKNGVLGSASGLAEGGDVQAFDLMDERPAYAERRRRADVHDDDDDDEQKTVVSRLNPALHPSAQTMFRQHSSSSTQLSPATATTSAWRARNSNDIELGV